MISLFGSAIQRFCMSLYVLELTGSPGIFATILSISMLPYVLLAPVAGNITDSFSKKKIMVCTDIFSGIVISCYAVFLFSGHDRPAVIAVTMILLSSASTVYSPAVTASIPLSVSAKQLYRANGIVQQIGSAANFAGPVIAGMLYGFLGIRWIVVLNAISFFASALMEGFLHLPEKKSGSKNKISFLNSVNEMYQGFLYLKKCQTIVLRIIFSYGLSNLFIVPVFSVAAPHFVKNVLGFSSEVYGSVEGITVLGMITGGSTDRCVSQEFFHGCDPQSALPDAGFLSFYVSDWICVPKPADESMCFWGRRLCCHAFSWAVQCDFIDLHATGSPRIYDRKDQCVFHGSGDSHDTSRTVFVRTDSRSRYFGSRVVSFCISGKPWDCMFCKTGNKKELRNFKKVLAFCI